MNCSSRKHEPRTVNEQPGSGFRGHVTVRRDSDVWLDFRSRLINEKNKTRKSEGPPGCLTTLTASPDQPEGETAGANLERPEFQHLQCGELLHKRTERARRRPPHPDRTAPLTHSRACLLIDEHAARVCGREELSSFRRRSQASPPAELRSKPAEKPPKTLA